MNSLEPNFACCMTLYFDWLVFLPHEQFPNAQSLFFQVYYQFSPNTFGYYFRFIKGTRVLVVLEISFRNSRHTTTNFR